MGLEGVEVTVPDHFDSALLPHPQKTAVFRQNEKVYVRQRNGKPTILASMKKQKKKSHPPKSCHLFSFRTQ
jgi:hypothetical protein